MFIFLLFYAAFCEIFLSSPKKITLMREPPVDNVVAADYKEDILQDLLLHMSCPQHCQTALGSFLLLKQTDAIPRNI